MYRESFELTDGVSLGTESKIDAVKDGMQKPNGDRMPRQLSATPGGSTSRRPFVRLVYFNWLSLCDC